MEDWHPPLSIVVISLIPTISLLTVLFLAIFRLNPFIFIIVGTASVFAIQSYFYAMYKYFKERKLKRLTILAVALALIIITPYSVYAITTPNWSFTVTTDKSVYKLGENVTITATLTNHGYIAHSFTTIKNPARILLYVGDWYWDKVWWSSIQLNETEFSSAPRQAIEKTVIWNQTVRKGHGTSLTWIPMNETGKYHVCAEVVDYNYTKIFFRSWTEITIKP